MCLFTEYCCEVNHTDQSMFCITMKRNKVSLKIDNIYLDLQRLGKLICKIDGSFILFLAKVSS